LITFTGRISFRREAPDGVDEDEGIASAIAEESDAPDGCLGAERKLAVKVIKAAQNRYRMADDVEENNGESQDQSLPDRPLECCECKRNIAVVYTEIASENVIRTCMCTNCPVLLKKLHGASQHLPGTGADHAAAGFSCGNCGTTLEMLRVGMPLGCSECYEVFDDTLLSELIAANKLPERITATKKTHPTHIGRAPGKAQEMNPSLKLLSLNEALTETLKREDYEQAALLRDQIKALTDNEEEADTQKKTDTKEKADKKEESDEKKQ